MFSKRCAINDNGDEKISRGGQPTTSYTINANGFVRSSINGAGSRQGVDFPSWQQTGFALFKPVYFQPVALQIFAYTATCRFSTWTFSFLQIIWGAFSSALWPRAAHKRPHVSSPWSSHVTLYWRPPSIIGSGICTGNTAHWHWPFSTASCLVESNTGINVISRVVRWSKKIRNLRREPYSSRNGSHTYLFL